MIVLWLLVAFFSGALTTLAISWIGEYRQIRRRMRLSYYEQLYDAQYTDQVGYEVFRYRHGLPLTKRKKGVPQ